MSLSLLSNAYLEETTNKTRAKPVPWEGYQRADLVTAEELALIKRVDRQPRARVESVLLSEGGTYALLYLSLLKKLQRVDTMQCLLVLIADALTDHEERIPLFTRTNQVDSDLPYIPLLKALDASDEFVQLKAAQILTLLLSFVDILKKNPGPQMSYQIAFCIWLLSFEQNIAEQINKRYDIIARLVEVAQEAVKEKVVRVIVATFRAESGGQSTVCKPARYVDEDIIEDIKFLKDELTTRFESLTTYDEYTSELESGHLSWTPVHESEEFWKENAIRLNEKDYEQLKKLIHLLKESEDPIVLAVASHDLGQYVRIVTDLGGKTRVMQLLTHQNPDVRYRALLSVQQIVSQPWLSA
ncbi:hypothetical protein EST38_g5096 [Candolleomyces aberdarensis]|uniref:ATPase V1 complex subunit H C-terminal domain-containing protein n=1 Tax=Candolleomyces aberdarensis TaxID=2316362 RepID=A0A4Q2DLB0_9AGAR|nr:hypothetical protein EST38_g5096 [Candolleomyces aberdarensis]